MTEASRRTQAAPRPSAARAQPAAREPREAVREKNRAPSSAASPAPLAAPYTAGVLRHWLDIQRANEAGVREGVDVEALHDFRVAMRRARSLFNQAGKVFSERLREAFRPEFAWLSRGTGPKRDLDVFAQHLREREDVRGLGPAIALVEQDALSAQRELLEVLDSERYARFVAEWSAMLEHTVAHGSRTRLGREPAEAVARDIVRRLLRRALREGRDIDADSPIEALHTLRKTCKKLRYVIDGYAPVLPGRSARRALRQLRTMQEQLGAVCDCDVQLGLAAALRERPELDGDRALARLTARLETELADMRRRFPPAFGVFHEDAQARAWRRLCGRGG